MSPTQRSACEMVMSNYREQLAVGIRLCRSDEVQFQSVRSPRFWDQRHSNGSVGPPVATGPWREFKDTEFWTEFPHRPRCPLPDSVVLTPTMFVMRIDLFHWL